MARGINREQLQKCLAGQCGNDQLSFALELTLSRIVALAPEVPDLTLKLPPQVLVVVSHGSCCVAKDFVLGSVHGLAPSA